MIGMYCYNKRHSAPQLPRVSVNVSTQFTVCTVLCLLKLFVPPSLLPRVARTGRRKLNMGVYARVLGCQAKFQIRGLKGQKCWINPGIMQEMLQAAPDNIAAQKRRWRWRLETL